MAHPLDGVRLKLNRAEHHLDTLDREIGAWRTRHPYEIVGQFETWDPLGCGPDWGYYFLRFRMFEPVPPDWGVIVGDCLHNARAALDHLAWQLVLFNGKHPNSSTQFPIFTTCENFVVKGKRMVAKMSDRHIGILADLQPYNRQDYLGNPSVTVAEQQPLAVLNVLSNMDKHRVLAPTPASVRSVGWDQPTEIRDMDLPNGIDSYPGFAGSLVDGSNLMSFLAHRTGPHPYMKLETEINIEISLGQNEPATETLRNILTEVRAVFARFVDELK